MEQSEAERELELFVTTSVTTSVSVRVTSPLFSSPKLNSSFTVTAGQVHQLTFSNKLRSVGTEMGTKGILVKASDEIVIYGFNKEKYSNDGFLGFPTDVLGKDYYAVCIKAKKYYTLILVVGVYDNTNVEIKLANNEKVKVQYNGDTYGKNTVLTVKVNRYSTFQVHSLDKGDLTGTYIKADKPVSFFSGNRETSVGTGNSADHLVDMQLPVDTWGKKFAIAPIPKRTTGDFYRFVASENDTNINVNGQNNGEAFSDSFTLNDAGSWVQKHYSSNLYAYVESSKPVIVAQYVLSQISEHSSEMADPSMMIIPPIEQYSADYTFSTPKYSEGSYDNYFMFVVNDAEKENLQMDGQPFPRDTKYNNIQGTELVAGYITLQDGTHTCRHKSDKTKVFGGYLFGKQYKESYAFPTGLRLSAINTVSSFRNSWLNTSVGWLL